MTVLDAAVKADEPVGRFTAFTRDTFVKSNEAVNGDYRLLVVSAPEEILNCTPGQFFHLLCPSEGADHPYLRRPMSIYGYDRARGELQFLYKVTGAGTRGLATLTPGAQLNVFGPLGRGYSIAPDHSRIMLVARGVGLATLAPLAQQARDQDCELVAVCSARSPDMLLSVDLFRDMGAKVITLTDAEGTSGTQNLQHVIEAEVEGQGVDAFYTCGSNRILRLLQTLSRRFDIPGQIALEQQMACGLGMCQCCVRSFDRGGRFVQERVCREGPVFDLQEALSC